MLDSLARSYRLSLFLVRDNLIELVDRRWLERTARGTMLDCGTVILKPVARRIRTAVVSLDSKNVWVPQTRIQPLPEFCPECRGGSLVHILWGYSRIAAVQVEEVGAGRTLLGLNRRYFAAIEQGDPALAPLLERTRLPSWACLDCRPEWIDLHQLALKECDVQTAKWAACDASDFEKAAILLQSQMKLENKHAADILRLMRELIGEAASEPPSAQHVRPWSDSLFTFVTFVGFCSNVRPTICTPRSPVLKGFPRSSFLFAPLRLCVSLPQNQPLT